MRRMKLLYGPGRVKTQGFLSLPQILKDDSNLLQCKINGPILLPESCPRSTAPQQRGFPLWEEEPGSSVAYLQFLPLVMLEQP